MKKFIQIFGLFAATCLLITSSIFSGCSKSDDDEKESDKKTVIDTTGTKISYYVALTYKDALTGVTHAAYYHDSLVTLEVQSDGNAYANALFVDNGDVYVAGSDNNNAVYWKNGAIHYLPEGTSASGIYVANGNVYVCGFENATTGQQARYWVNDTPAYSLTNGSRAEGIVVDNTGHIYIVGYCSESSGIETLYYWVGTEGSMPSWKLAADATENACEGRAITLDYTHYDSNGLPFVCIASLEYARTGYMCKQWVNRRCTKLDQTSGNDLNDIVAVDGKLYSCGKIAKQAYYWVSTIASTGACKDVQAISLTDGSELTYATAISVLEDHVYVCGYRYTDRLPYIWKDGKQFNLLPNSVTSLSIDEVADISVIREKIQ